MVIYLTGVVVMAFAILYFNGDTLKVFCRVRNFWIAILLTCLTSWVGLIAAGIVYLIDKYHGNTKS